MGNYAKILFVFALLFLFVGLSFAQIQTVRIVVKGVTPDLKALGRYDVVSSGLPNVGKGQKVWLEALALYTDGTNPINSWVDTITTQVWTITGPPGSLITAPVHTDTTIFFIPDTTGQYLVNLSVTTSNGTKDTSMYINAATWVGVGNISGPATNPAQCGFGCHSGKMTEWNKTGHASIFAYNVDSSDHYSGSCVSCHTVGYDALGTAVNGGWDDIATGLGFTIPSPQHPGVWDSIKTNFPTLANVSNIQCENCHGPGSLHVSQTDKNKIASTYSADMCGQCHGKKYTHGKNYEWNSTSHAKSVGEPGEVEHMNSSSCAQCHTAQGFVTENIGHNASGAPYADVQSVTCTACHDPHSEANPSQLRVASLDDACDGCHKNRISSRGLHHSPQGPMVAGVNGTPFTLGTSGVGTWGGLQFPGYQYRNSSHSSISGTCVECHMAPISGADTLLINAPFAQYRSKLGGHTFRVAWDNDTPDDATDDILNPVGCKECHGNVNLEFVEQSQEKIKTLLEELRLLLPKSSSDSTMPATHTTSSLTTVQKAASYNWYFVSYDGSYGVHNYEYAAALLRSSIEMVKLGVGAADITLVKDIPNDQGKQVQIVWNKFPAENYPEAVTNYLILREDSVSGMPKSSGMVIAASYREMLAKVAGGSRVILAGSVWTKVGEYKAIKLPQYSLIVPTLYDSTIVGGIKQSSFEVVGYTAGTTVYTSAPATGYSIDNLAPAPPMIAAQSGSGFAKVTWNEAVDNDFDYFAIYRGTTESFVPSGTPLATTSAAEYTDNQVTVGATYYYKVTTFDFSGNQSDYSNEVSIMVTSVGEGLGMPTTYALRQNHPNPFNPSTKISYELPEAARVKISVYNTLGMLVSTLVDADQNAGYHMIDWNGTDNSGNTIASGIYLYKMETGTYTALKKMIFIK